MGGFIWFTLIYVCIWFIWSVCFVLWLDASSLFSTCNLENRASNFHPNLFIRLLCAGPLSPLSGAERLHWPLPAYYFSVRRQELQKPRGADHLHFLGGGRTSLLGVELHCSNIPWVRERSRDNIARLHIHLLQIKLTILCRGAHICRLFFRPLFDHSVPVWYISFIWLIWLMSFITYSLIKLDSFDLFYLIYAPSPMDFL